MLLLYFRMKNVKTVIGIIAGLIIILFIAVWQPWQKETAVAPAVKKLDPKEIFAGYSYEGVPAALAAQHRLEAMSVRQISGEGRVEIVTENSLVAREAFKKKELYFWHRGLENDRRVISYAQKNDKGECVGFSAYYSLTRVNGKENNSITNIEPVDLCREQPAKERDVNEQKENDRADEILRLEEVVQ